MDVEVRHLRAFIAVAQSHSFTRAAERLLITQPALTRTVRQLEKALDVVLIDRTTHPVSLTAAGREFFPYASHVVNHLDVGVGAVRQLANVRLGFSWLLPHPWARDTIAEFERAAGVSVTLVRCDDPVAALHEGVIDVGVARGDVTGGASVSVVHLFDEVRVAVCAQDSPLAERDSIAWDDVPSWPLVVNTVSGTTGSWSWPAGAGPARIVPTANFDEWLESVAAGLGIGVVPVAAQQRNVHPGVRYVPITGAPDSAVSLVFRPDVRTSLVRRFVDTALAAAP